MKIKVIQDQLASALKAAQNVITNKMTLPILGNALIKTAGKELLISATNLSESLSIRIPCEVSKAGALTLPAKKLLSVVAECAGELSITWDEKVAAIKSGSADFKMSGLPEKDFPELPAIPKSESIKIKQWLLRSLLSKVAYCMCEDAARGSMCGTLVRLSKNLLQVVASDGKRVAQAEQEIETQADVDLVIPAEAVAQLMRLLQPCESLVEIRYDEKKAHFEMGNISFSCTLFEQPFPRIEKAIPIKYENRIALKRKFLEDTIRRVSVLLQGEKVQQIKLLFSKNSLEVSSRTPEVGESTDSMAIVYSGPDIQIGFNPLYLLEPLREIQEDEISFDLTDGTSPGVIRSNNFVYVLMPLRIL